MFKLCKEKAGHVWGPLDSEMIYVQKNDKSNIGKTGCSEITKGLERLTKEFFTSVD